MKTLKIILLGAILVIGSVACNKTKINSKRFMKAGEWKVTELSVDGSNEAELPSWEIKECDIYKESCKGEWKNDEGGHAEFVWQFREKGKKFEISRQAEEEDDHGHGHGHGDNHAAEEAAAQAYAFSGVYDVVERKKKKMQFETTAALGHAGKKVVIKIEKK